MGLKKILYNVINVIAIAFRPFNSYYLTILKNQFYTCRIRSKFRHVGQSSLIIAPLNVIVGGKYISVGENSTIGKYVTLAAWDRFGDRKYSPSITMGDNSSIGDFSHVTSINNITIGNNVRMGKSILITDNSHGLSDVSEIGVAPNKRPLYSKGAVIIEDNVWIGEKSSILPGVRIGFGSIVAANSVVTKNVAPYSVVGGNPAKVIKIMRQ